MLNKTKAKQIKYRGYAVGSSIALSDIRINILKRWNEAIEECLSNENEMRSNIAYNELFNKILDNKNENSSVIKIYSEGLKAGIIYGIKQKGLKPDDSHLNNIKKSEQLRYVFNYISDYLNRKNNTKNSNNVENSLFIANLAIMFNVKVFRDMKYMSSIVNSIVNNIISNSDIRINIQNIIKNEFKEYINSFELVNNS